MKGWDQRFGGIERLVGKTRCQRIQEAHICIIGIGGVGSWAAESLARSGIGQLSLIDMDEVCVTNVNRQIHALDSTVGLSKAKVMRERIGQINPDCEVSVHNLFLNEENAGALLERPYHVVIDAIDRAPAKCLILSQARDRQLPVISVGAAGGRLNPLLIESADLSRVHHDRLLQRVRKQLRNRFGFPRNRSMGIACIFSPEPPTLPSTLEMDECEVKTPLEVSGRLGCAQGYGSITQVTGSFGFVAASLALQALMESPSEVLPHGKA